MNLKTDRFPADPLLRSSLQKREDLLALRKLALPGNLIDFCSNDYLGFARNPSIGQAVDAELAGAITPNGSGGSRLLAGNSRYAEELEDFLAGFHDVEAALVYNSGYDANVGLFSAIGQKETTIIYDELIHASVHDGIRMSSAASYMFRHNDLFHLEERLKNAGGTVFVAIESIYSMDGDEAMIPAIAALCEQYRANLVVDEAHATGVTMNGGKGLVQQMNLQDQVFARVHTFGKALGCHGAAIVGSRLLRDFLVNYSRSFIYTTALPVRSHMAVKQAYLLLQKSQELINMLHRNITVFRQQLEGAALVRTPSLSPVQCIVMPGNENIKKAALELQGKGFDVRPILSPTVAKGKERLRICLHSFNSTEEIGSLTTALLEMHGAHKNISDS